MKLDNIDVNEAIENAQRLLNGEKELSPAIKSAFQVILLLVKILLTRLNITSKNSSKPPSSDPNRKRGSLKKKSGKKQGGQNGHVGARLSTTDSPDKIKTIKIDRRTIPYGNYKDAGYESRQVIDINISTITTEYRAQILEDDQGKQFVAEFPVFATKDIQYGPGVKSHSAYMSQFQLLPYARIQDYFSDQMNLPLSTGSIFNFNREAYDLLGQVDQIIAHQLTISPLVHADETGIKVDKKGLWLHCASNNLWTYYSPHKKRGCDALNEIGILPKFKGTLCHDHWKPYYKYTCSHSLCNAHHLRELEFAYEQDGQKWASTMQKLLFEINKAVGKNKSGKLSKPKSKKYRNKYRDILEVGKKECPLPEIPEGPPKRGRRKKSKSRNLLERLELFENDVLRFMVDPIVPFTNNLAENDLRMTKVQQKISGCFRSLEGANIFCRVRSYLSTCRKHDVSATEALELLFRGELPDFLSAEISD